MVSIGFSNSDSCYFESLIFLNNIRDEMRPMIVYFFDFVLELLNSSHVGQILFVLIGEESQLRFS